MAAVFVLILSSCGGSKTDDIAKRVQQYYQNVQSCSIRAVVKADYTDRLMEFTLLYSIEDGVGTVTVIKPEEIAGIRAEWDGDSGQMSYEGIMLETGSGEEDGVTPVNALPLLLSSWAEGYVTEAYIEKYDGGECFVLSSSFESGGRQSECRTWFENETYQPLKSEISIEKRVFIYCEYEKCSFN